MKGTLNIVTLCTGNVARSVMLGYMLTTLGEVNGADWQIRTAGTHVLEGSSMSARTRDALLTIDELGEHQYGSHRSHQLDADDVEWSDVILASEADHVAYVHRHFPSGRTRAVQLAQFVRDAPLDETFERQLEMVTLLGPSPEFDVADPAGGEQSVYNECAALLWELSQVFATLVTEQEVD
jgi:protein-tyrosine-phosphatase